MKRKCKYGVIEFRGPNLEEGLKIMSTLDNDNNALISIADNLDLIFNLFTKIDLVVNEKKIDTPEKLKEVSRVEIMTLIVEIRNDIQSIMFDVDEEKKS